MAEQALAAILQQMQASNEAFTRALATQEQQMIAQRTKSEADVAALRTALEKVGTAAAAASESRGVVDVKQVGKPDFRKGSKEAIQREWGTWSYTFITWFCSQYEKGEEAFEWPHHHKSYLAQFMVVDKSHESGWLFIVKLNAQLHVALVSLCRAEALTVVKNSGKRQRFNSWRRLNA